MITTATLCPHGHNVYLTGHDYGWNALCDCYDGAEDAGPQLVGHGNTPEAALDAFVECEEERAEVEWWPNDLAFQIRAESKLSANYRVIDGVYGPVPVPLTA